jgi:glycosyltransferase involved in cell wall biosynthesis
MTTPGLSVIIPAKDAATTLSDQLDAILAAEGNFEVLVCDNGSRDDTPRLVARRSKIDPRLRLIVAADAPGSGHARNIGADRARSDKLAFCDADDVVGAEWVRAMTSALEVHDFVTGPLELDQLNSAVVIRSRGRWLEGNEAKTFDGLFPFASGCNMGLRRQTFNAVGRFDETFIYGQDVELSLRLWAAGIRMGFSTDALVHYRYRADLEGMWTQGRNHGATRPHIYRRMADVAPALPRVHINWRSWLWLARHVGDLARPVDRGRWLWLAGSKAGHLRGSLSARTVCL